MTRGQHRDAFTIDDTKGERFALALDLFRSGRSFEFRDVGFLLDDAGVVHCVVDSSWRLANVTAATALDDLALGHAAFQELLNASPEFRAMASTRPIRYDLIEDYGNGSVLLCTQADGQLVWADGLPKRAV